MKRLLTIFICLCMLVTVAPPFAMAEETSIIEIYVSPTGNDANAGTVNAPLKTLVGARDKIRSLKNGGAAPSGGFIVYLREGDYQQTEGLAFDNRDSGTKDAPVVYMAYPGENVTLVGGVSIPGSAFTEVTDSSVLSRIIETSARSKVKVADLKTMGFTEFGEPYWPGAYSYMASWLTEPKAASPELFVDGKVQTIARYPNEGYMKIETVYDVGAIPRNWEPDRIADDRYVPEDQRDPTDTFEITFDDDRFLKWSQVAPRTALMSGYFFYDWADHSVPIEKVENGRIYSSEPSWYGVREGQRLFVMNLIEEIDIPGEYYLDRENGLLYIYPEKDLTNANIKFSLIEDDLISISNAKYITFKGIKMTAMRSGAVNIVSGNNIEIDGCEIEYTADYAVHMGPNTRNCYVMNSNIHDVDGGVYVRSGDVSSLTYGNSKVVNNVFTRFSRITQTYCPAVQLNGVGNIVENNEMYDAPHCAVQYAGNEHSISYNEIYDVCQNADDMGAIYSGRSWVQRGTKIHYNHIHDIRTDSEQVVGLSIIYFDDRLSQQSVVGNLIRNCDGRAFYSNGGRDHVFSNNIIINQELCYQFGAIIPPDPFAVEPVNLMASLNTVPWQSELWTTKYPLLATILDIEGDATYPNNNYAGNNVLINCAPKTIGYNDIHPVAYERGTFEPDYEAKTLQFVDEANGNYLLPANSPVFRELPNFRNLPISRMGRYDSSVDADYVAFSDNFENETDEVPDNWQLFKETSKATITVESENGNKFLRVNPTANWQTDELLPGAVTKPGKVNVPSGGGTIVVEMKIRSKVVSASTKQNVRLSVYDVPNLNENLLFATRDYGTGDSAINDIFCFPTTADNSVVYRDADYKISDNTWYKVTAKLDFEKAEINYTVGNDSQGYRNHTISVQGSTLASNFAANSITLLMEQVSPGNYTDIDDIFVGYLNDYEEYVLKSVSFSDDFEKETDEVPDNWQLFKPESTGVMTVMEEDGNKFLRVNPTQNWASGEEVPGAVTKPGKVSIPTDKGTVLIKTKIRSKIICDANTQQNIKLSTYDVPYINSNLLFATRDYGDVKDIFCFPTTVDNAVTYSNADYKLADNTWYEVVAKLDFINDTASYIVGNEEQGYRSHTSNIKGSALASLDVVDSVTLLLDQVIPGNYTDIDDVYVGYLEGYVGELPSAITFEDSFEYEADKTPDNWQLFKETSTGTMTIETEDGNKFLRVNPKENWDSGVKVPGAVTKPGKVNVLTNGGIVVVKMKIRSFQVSANTQQNVKLSTYDVPYLNTNLLFATRDSGDVKDIFCFPTIADDSITYKDANFKISDNTWYSVTAMMDYSLGKINYIVGNQSQGYKRYTVNIKGSTLASLDSITSVTLLLDQVSPGNYTDIDDVSVKYLPKSNNFEDTFENLAANSTPENYTDRAGVSTIKVMEETGNKFVRITKDAGTSGVPQVATKDGLINIPWSENKGNAIVLEAKIRQQNTDYRSLIMLNAPYLATDDELGANYNTPFYIHTSKDVYFMPGYISMGTKINNLNEWVNYRAVMLVGESKTQILHYFNGEYKTTTEISSSAMADVYNSYSLNTLSFVWRPASGNPSQATNTGYMDFDDVRVYTVKDFSYEIDVINSNGVKTENIENGIMNINVELINDGADKALDVFGALYTKSGDDWRITEAKMIKASGDKNYLATKAWEKDAGNLSFNVTDKDNQMIKVFVWYRATEPISMIMKPACLPYVID